jgi:hypothetical protein
MRTLSKITVAFVVLFFSTTLLFAQNQTVVTPKIPIDTVTKLITYSEVVKQDGIKDTLYNRAIHWVNLNYKNPQSVTTIREMENGKIVGNHRFKVYNLPVKKDDIKTDGPIVEYTFTILLKDNKYRIIITNLYTKNAGSKFLLERWLDKKDPSYQAAWDSYIVQVDANIKDIIKSLKKGMLEAVKVSKDW